MNSYRQAIASRSISGFTLRILRAMHRMLVRPCDKGPLLDDPSRARLTADPRREMLWTMLDQSPEIVVCYDTALRRTYANATYKRHTGQVSNQYLGRPVDEHSVVGTATDDMVACLRRALATGQEQRLDFEWRTAEGTLTWQALRVSPVRDATGAIIALVNVSRDITDRKLAECQLAQREREFRALVENSTDCIVRYNTQGERLYVNPAMRALVAERHLGLDQPPDQGGGPIVDVTRYRQLIQEVVETGEARSTELLAHGPDGRERWIDMRFCAEIDETGQVVSVLTMGRDVTDAVVMRNQFAAQALSDPLTHLGNRRAAYERGGTFVDEAQRHGRQLGVMLLDLDRFKEINDTLGHQAGDQLLAEVAARLARATRRYDFLARLGGDEFVILVPSLVQADDMAAIAAKIRLAMREPVHLNGRTVHASASIGIAVCPRDGEQLDMLLEHADLAMSQAKRNGLGGVMFYQGEFAAQVQRRVDVEGGLREASDGTGLELYYQPQMRLDLGTLVGVEALLRWHHSTLGLVPPEEFIPIAEASGLIVPIGRWVLSQACAAAVRWNRNRASPLRVAVNVSVLQFLRDDLADVIHSALANTGCVAGWLTVEVTESLLVKDSARIVESLRELTRMGVSIEIDDFGTGYSALSYLTRFDVHGLKIDRTFMRGISTEQRQRELVKAFIAIAKALRMSVVAEGVETQAEADFLLALGCQKAQGFLYGAPMPAAAFELEWLQATAGRERRLAI